MLIVVVSIGKKRIWPISLSRSLPSSVQLDGFDITDAQFPPREWLPANVTLDTMNILAPVPQHLAGKYDVVNIRYFGLLVKNNDHLGLLKHLTSLLSESCNGKSRLLSAPKEKENY
jgi:hypothetical protein